MNTATATSPIERLSLALKTQTASEHERMHQLMEAADVFSTQHLYAQFTLSQYYFQLEIEQLFEQQGVAALIPDLQIRGRSQHALQDLQDLGIHPQGRALQAINLTLPEILGWIYVSEGSTLGAAFLFKLAQKNFGFSDTFAARNLAAYPEGRAIVWKRFVEALDQADFDQAEKALVIQGAMQAYAYFGELLTDLKQLQ